MSNRTILVVEDDSDLREMLLLVLSSRGFDVQAVADGAAALDRLGQWPRPDALLVDLRMPVLDGTTFLQRVRTNPEISGLPVVVMSGERGGHDLAMRAGATAFLAKPFGIAELVAVMSQAIGQGDGPQPSP